MTITEEPPQVARTLPLRLDSGTLSARVAEILGRRAAIGLCMGVISEGSMVSSHHGLADISSGTPITDDTVFRIGSITKTLTAVAIMQLCEQGRIELDRPASDYLRSFVLVPSDPDFRPATVRHLLTHTAGIPEVLHPLDVFRPLFGEITETGRTSPQLVDYYGAGLPITVEPGERFTYSDHGFAALGQIVEDVSGERLDGYMRDHIFSPLGMTDTDLVRSDRVRPRLAIGYSLGSGGAKRVNDYEVVTAGAGGVYSTMRDMARYVAALLGGGANELNSILRPETLETMFDAHYRPDPRVPGVGLAFCRGQVDGHRIVEHGGILPGFDAHLIVAPDDGVGILAFTNGSKGAMLWLSDETRRLLHHLLGLPERSVREDLAQHPEIWSEACGRYALSARLTDVRARMASGLGVDVFVEGGRLMLRPLTPIPALYAGFPLHPDDPDDPYILRLDLGRLGAGTLQIAFTKDLEGRVTAVHLAEGWPLSARRVGRRRPPARKRAANETRSMSEKLRGGSRIPIRDASLFVNVVGQGYPLVLMHGGPSADQWTMAPFRRLADRFTIIFYDHRCNGRSVGPPVESMTWENLTADADALREHLGFERWAVLGHSFGGHVALEYALRYPDNLSHLVLLDTGGDSHWSQQNAPRVLAERGYDAATVELARRWFNGEFEPKEQLSIFLKLAAAYEYDPGLRLLIHQLRDGAWRSKLRPEAQIHGFRHLVKGWSVIDRLNEITVPTLVVAGTHDFVFPPACQRELAEGIPEARLRMIEQTGHNPHVERPLDVMDVVGEFLSDSMSPDGGE